MRPSLSLAVAFVSLCSLSGLARGSDDDANALASAMQCVAAQMTDARLPVAVMPEQIASASIFRCSDQIEAAANAVAGSNARYEQISVARATVRRALYEYALDVAGGSAADATGTAAVSAETWQVDESIACCRGLSHTRASRRAR
jgi:hypothetical protein